MYRVLKLITRSTLFAVLSLTILATACTQTEASSPFVDLSRREPIPVVTEPSEHPLRIAIAAVLSPKGNRDSYNDLARYLGNALGRPAEIVQRRTYAEINDLVASGDVDIAFVCTSAYVSGHDLGDMDLLVVPMINGGTTYRSSLIVPRDSQATSMEDLRGTVFAFTDPMSQTGRAYPTFLVQELGETPASFFSDTFFTYSHDRAIAAVADHVADGAAVDSIVLDYKLKAEPSLGSRIKVIHTSPPFGIPPVVVPSSQSQALRNRIRDVLLSMADDPSGARILADLEIDRFIIGDDAAYDSVRDVLATTGIGP